MALGHESKDLSISHNVNDTSGKNDMCTFEKKHENVNGTHDEDNENEKDLMYEELKELTLWPWKSIPLYVMWCKWHSRWEYMHHGKWFSECDSKFRKKGREFKSSNWAPQHHWPGNWEV